jgi:hypothetical protein
MTIEIKTKINKLLSILPEGALATTPWLESQGISSQLVSHYEKSGWLEAIGYGAYTRNKKTLTWQGGVYSMQSQLNIKMHVGAKTALELRRLLHFIPQTSNSSSYLYLFSNKNLPAWFLKYPWGIKICCKPENLFKSSTQLAMTTYDNPFFNIRISAPERAIMELLYFVPSKQGLEEAFLILEGLTTLRPKVIQDLLEACQSVKVKRLFCALSKQTGHAWFKKLTLTQIDFGKGKRVIGNGGSFDSEFLITIPKKQEVRDDQ